MGLPELPQKQMTSRGDQVRHGTAAASGKLNTEENKATGNIMSVANPKRLKTSTKAKLKQMAKIPQISAEWSPGGGDALCWGGGDQGIPYSWDCEEVLSGGRGASCSGSLAFSLRHMGRMRTPARPVKNN